MQIKLVVSLSHRKLTLGQPLLVITPQSQAPGRVATGVPFFESLAGPAGKAFHKVEGCPQLCSSSSSVTSCIECPRTYRATFTDGLALLCREEYINTANCKLQQALQVIETGNQSWLVKINEKKTTFTVFSIPNQQQRVHLKLNGQPLRQEDAPTYLGVTLDRKLTRKNQLQRNLARAKVRLALMKKLLCTEWGTDQNVLQKHYVGIIRPVLV